MIRLTGRPRPASEADDLDARDRIAARLSRMISRRREMYRRAGISSRALRGELADVPLVVIDRVARARLAARRGRDRTPRRELPARRRIATPASRRTCGGDDEGDASDDPDSRTPAARPHVLPRRPRTAPARAPPRLSNRNFSRQQKTSTEKLGEVQLRANEIFQGYWFRAVDVDEPIVGTIVEVGFEDFGGRPVRFVGFAEHPQKLRLSRDRWDSIAAVAECDDDELWVGVTVELYKTLAMYDGRSVPSIGVRPPGGWPDAAD